MILCQKLNCEKNGVVLILPNVKKYVLMIQGNVDSGMKQMHQIANMEYQKLEVKYFTHWNYSHEKESNQVCS